MGRASNGPKHLPPAAQTWPPVSFVQQNVFTASLSKVVDAFRRTVILLTVLFAIKSMHCLLKSTTNLRVIALGI